MRISDVDTVRVADVTVLGDALANTQNILNNSQKLTAEERARAADLAGQAESAIYKLTVLLEDIGDEVEL